MRADITIVPEHGAAFDLGIDAPRDVQWPELHEALSSAGLASDLIAASGEFSARNGAVVQLGVEQPAGAGARLRVVGGLEAGKVLTLRPGINTIGRGVECTHRLHDPEVSRQHFEVVVDRRGVTITQRHVANPAAVNGEPTPASYVLQPGDRLRVGSTVLTMDAPAVSDGPSTPDRIDVPASRMRTARPGWSIAMLALPTAAGVLAAVVAGSGRVVLLSVVTGVALLASLLAGQVAFGGGGRRARRAHLAALRRAHAAIAAARVAEAAERHHAAPDPCALLVGQGRARLPGLQVRVGLGAVPAQFAIAREGEQIEHPLLDDVPVCVDLDSAGLTLKAPAELARRQAYWLLCQLAATYSPAELGVALYLDPTTEPGWRWTRWLPQLRQVQVGHHPPIVPGGTGSAESPRHCLAIHDGVRELPMSTPTVIRVGGSGGDATLVPVDDSGARQLLTGRGRSPIRVTVETMSRHAAESVARAIAARGPQDNDVPAEVRLLDLLGMSSSPTADEICTMWDTATCSAQAPLGLGPGGAVVFDLDRDGPHALVGGTTGSGKSELLQTLVFGLGARHPPDAMQFLLIDYKGGAAFGRCQALPHTAGVVTDLDAAQTMRALRSLSAELRRRETLLAAAEAPDFLTYLRRAVEPRLARLVVIVDEFATLGAELPEFVAGLISIAQRGRSLGMHLVLATQRPGGAVSPAIRANVNLRIALRTISSAESVDLIDCPDAARLEPARPGQAIRAGAPPQPFQVAHLGPGRGPATIRVTTLDDWRRPLTEPGADNDRQHDADALIAAIADATARLQRPTPPALWLPPLPNVYWAPRSSPDDRTIPIGLVDQPDEQRQDLLHIDLGTGGTIVIAGGPRSGRTATLVSAARSASDGLSADDLQIYALDFGGGGLEPVGRLPHLGTMTNANVPISLTSALVARLTQRMAQRTDAPGPPTLLLIDDWAALCAAADAHDLGVTTARLRGLLAAAGPARLTVLIAGDRAALGPALSSLADERFVLRCADPLDYQIAGISPADVPPLMPPRRAIRARDGAEVQLCLAPETEATDGPTSRQAIRVVALPNTLPSAHRPRRRGYVHLGLGGDMAEPVWLRPSAAVQLLVAGSRRSGKSTLLASIVSQLDEPPLAVVAAPESRLGKISIDLGYRVLTEGQIPTLDATGVVVVDDVEDLADSPLDAALTMWARQGGRLIVSGSTDRLATSFRGLAAAAKRWHRGVVLQPSALDGDLFGLRLNRTELAGGVGRGLAVGEPSWCWPTTPDQPGRCTIQTWGP